MTATDSCEQKSSSDCCGNKSDSTKQATTMNESSFGDRSTMKDQSQYSGSTIIDRKSIDNQKPCGESVSQTDETVKNRYQNTGSQLIEGENWNVDRAASSYKNDEKSQNCNGEKVSSTESGKKESINVADTNYKYGNVYGSEGASDSNTKTTKTSSPCEPTVTKVSGVSKGYDQGYSAGTNQVNNNYYNQATSQDKATKTVENCNGDKSTTSNQNNSKTIGQSSDNSAYNYANDYGGGYKTSFEEVTKESPCPPCASCVAPKPC